MVMGGLSAQHLALDAHGCALRAVSDALGEHLQGLGVLARAARKSGLVSNRMSRRLVRLDEAYALLRHITSASVAALLRDLSLELKNCKGGTMATTQCSEDRGNPSALATSQDTPSATSVALAREDDELEIVASEVGCLASGCNVGLTAEVVDPPRKNCRTRPQRCIGTCTVR